MAKRTSFSEFDQNVAAKQYREMIDSIHNFTEGVVKHFTERVKHHPYIQLQNVGNVFVDFNNNDLQKNLQSSFQDWVSSENSFSASIDTHAATKSDATKRAAANLESRLSESISAGFKTLDPITLDDPTSCDSEDIMKDAVYIEGLSKQLASMKDTCCANYAKYSDNNSILATMMPLIADTFTNVEAGYQAAYKDVMKVSEEFAEANAKVKARDISAGNVRKNNVANLFDEFSNRRHKR